MSKNTNSKKLETAENLSPATLAKIAQIRSSEADGFIDKKTAERYIRVAIGLATGGSIVFSKNIDRIQLMAVREGLSTIYTLISIASDIIYQRSFDQNNGSPLESTTLDTCDAHNILKLLDIADSRMGDVENALTLLCAE